MIHKKIATQLDILATKVAKTIELLNNDCSIPFIARYRKEHTGGLDEVEIASIKDALKKAEDLDKRRHSIIQTIDEQGVLTEDLKQRLLSCEEIQELEDLYLPYKKKRKTKASIARENGLEPLAKMLMAQQTASTEQLANRFTSSTVENTEAALEGARHIIAEWINEHLFARKRLRSLFEYKAILCSKVIKTKIEEADKYKDYFDWEERLNRCASHRFLAISRGATEGLLRVHAYPEEIEALDILSSIFVKANNDCATQVKLAIKDSYQRLLKPALTTELLNKAKHKADETAIRVFAENLKQLLLAPPLGKARVLAIDPGFRSGCKLVCLDEQGALLHNETIYPHPPQSDSKGAMKKITSLINSFRIDAIAIGNGTAGRETEQLISRIRFNQDVKVFSVHENGASVYSASSIARAEFPQYDVTVRGAVSIGRRLMDPLAELVKIDPKAIGVGQYQHDVDQQQLKESLNEVVAHCVNAVGVNLNTASEHLLSYVSGLGPKLAENILSYRNENGPFKDREELKKVTRLGAKAFEQAAGFLRIRNGKNPLDNAAVHPESYGIVRKMAKDLSIPLEDLIGDKEKIKTIKIENYTTAQIGLPSLQDIIKELQKPGLDPRNQIEMFAFDSSIKHIDDLSIGLVLPGIINNITNFGCFVDIGIKENGLVHISQLTDRFISDPAEVVRLHQHVMVKILEIDTQRKRIALSMKDVKQ